MNSISKIALKKQLKSMGIRVEGNYVRKQDIVRFFKQKALAVDSSY